MVIIIVEKSKLNMTLRFLIEQKIKQKILRINVE